MRFSQQQVLEATQARQVRAGSRASFGAVCTDSRSLVEGSLFVALVGERFDGNEFVANAARSGAAGAIVNEGRTPGDLPEGFAVFEVKDTLQSLGALARFHRLRFKLPVAAITGSNGKTTTKEMVAAILATRGPVLKTEGNLNNEVGLPRTIFDLEPTHCAAVLEMGMNHPGEISRLTQIASPDAGLVTVVQPAHLHGLGSIEGVARAKGELFEGLGASATAVVNVDDPYVVAQAFRCKGRTLSFGHSDGAEVRLVSVEPRGREGMVLRIQANGREHSVRLAFVGAHNALNATGAFALAMALGYSPEECVRGLEAARPYLRRLNVLDAPKGFTVVDDCYNANPASMTAALDTLRTLSTSGRAVAVLGDMLELGPEETSAHQALGRQAAQVAKLAAFFGPRSRGGMEAAAMGAAAAHFTEVEPLVTWLSQRLAPGDVVLVKGSRGMKLERVVAALIGTPQEAH